MTRRNAAGLSGRLFRRRAVGFTLAEILIAMSILGVIATFTIPKVLTAYNQQQLNMILKDDIAAIQAITYAGVQDGSLSTSNNLYSYYAGNLNAVKQCDTDSSTQGCWNSAIQGVPSWGSEYNEPGFIMSNGSVIAGFNNTSAPVGGSTLLNGFIIDANGNNGPNQFGVDQIYLSILFGTGNTPCNSGSCIPGLTPNLPGTVVPNESTEPNSALLFQKLFAK